MEQHLDRAEGASTIVVVTGGAPVEPDDIGPLPKGALVIAADSGVGHAHRLGLRVDVAVGDFDSVDPAALALAADDGAVIERHPEAKDSTDLELALDAALLRQPQRIVVVGGHGGRLDHLLANALLLAAPRTAGTDIVAYLPPATITVVRRAARLVGEPGDLVTLLPAHGPAVGVTTRGLLYPLDGEDLEAGSTRGVSNELACAEATVTVDGGVLLAVQPGAPGSHLSTAADAALAHEPPERIP